MGELWDKGELDTALGVIRRANTDAHADPLVLTFVHGWKNNAAPDNGNVAGFEVALQEIYARLQRTRPVIGIYIGWRGNLIRPSWPVAQQFSYFNREATATRIPNARLSSALTQIALRTHENPHALAIFIGHSFGGLLLERAISETTASEIAQSQIYSQEAGALPSGSAEAATKACGSVLPPPTPEPTSSSSSIPPGAATEAKPMLDFLVTTATVISPFPRAAQRAMELPQTMLPTGRSSCRSPPPPIWPPKWRFLSAMLCPRSDLKRRAAFAISAPA